MRWAIILKRLFCLGVLAGLGYMASPAAETSGLSAEQNSPTAEIKQPQTGKPTDQGAAQDTLHFLDRFQPGQAFAEFIKLHPRAIYSRMEHADRVPTPDQPGGLLEEWDADPWLGLECIADMGFRDTGALYEFVIMWRGKERDVAGRTAMFYRGCLERNGAAFSREILLLNPDREGQGTPVPVLVWDKGDWRFLAYCVPRWENRPEKPGVCVYACIERSDPTLESWLNPANVSAETRETLWKELDKILQPLIREIEAGNQSGHPPK